MTKGVLIMNPHSKKKLLHYISMAGTFMFLFGIIYLLQKYTIGLFLSLNSQVVMGIPLDILIFTPSTLIIMKCFFKIQSPYIDD